MNGYKCPLGKFVPNRPDIDKIKSDAWHNDKILVIHADDPRLDWVEQQQIRNIGDLLFGNHEGNL